MCKQFWAWVLRVYGAFDLYAHTVIARFLGNVPYTPPPERRRIYIDPREEFDVYMYDPGLPPQRQLRALRIQLNGGTFTAHDRRRLMARDKCCLRCGTTENLSMDHVVPVAKGGKHSISNAQVLCRSCNSWKHTKIVDFRAKD